jgi:hypothetical protein
MTQEITTEIQAKKKTMTRLMIILQVQSENLIMERIQYQLTNIIQKRMTVKHTY